MTAKAAASETLTAVVNGSVTPSVISFLSSGSGRVSTSISVSRKTNATMKAGTIAKSAIRIRVRSSPRCSTSVASSPCCSRRGRCFRAMCR